MSGDRGPLNLPEVVPEVLAPGMDPARTIRRAYLLAAAADLLQWVVLPVFAGGALSPANNVLDILIALVMVRWLGWHWAFLPTFIAELVPGLGLFPTWLAAVWFVTRGLRRRVRLPQRGASV